MVFISRSYAVSLYVPYVYNLVVSVVDSLLFFVRYVCQLKVIFEWVWLWLCVVVLWWVTHRYEVLLLYYFSRHFGQARLVQSKMYPCPGSCLSMSSVVLDEIMLSFARTEINLALVFTGATTFKWVHIL